MKISLEKNNVLSSSRTEHYRVNYEETPKVENKRLFHKKGVIVFLRELFSEANIKFEAYYSSIKFFVNGKEHIIFQHTNKNSNIEWFHFSDLFKGRTIKPFLRRIKKFLVEKMGAYIKEIFDKFMGMLDKYLGGLVDEAKKEVAKETKIPAKKMFFISDDKTFHFKYFGLLNLRFNSKETNIIVNVAKEFFDKNRKNYMKVIEEIVSNLYEVLMKDTSVTTLTIRKRPIWLIS